MYKPAENAEGNKTEWIEFVSNKDIALLKKTASCQKDCQLKDFYVCTKMSDRENGTCLNSYPVYMYGDNIPVIHEKDYIVIAKSPEIFLSTYHDFNGVVLKVNFNLLENEDAVIAYSLDNKTTWKEIIFYSDFFRNKKTGYSLERIDVENYKNTKDNWQESYVDGGTPGKEHSIYVAPKIEEPKIYPKNISITELFPNPFKSQYEEYIELYNGSDEKIDLKNWTLHDASKTGKYVFPESLIIGAKKYLAIFKKDFKFALNNSGNESVVLLDPNGTEVARIDYNGSKRNASYNFNGTKWRWSKFLTPSAENVFNNEPVGTLKIDKDVYENVYANFSIATSDSDGDKVKVTWDFGDGHKSYLSKTRHKFAKTGTYLGSVKYSDGSEDVVKNFTVDVEEFPHPEVKIISINANPAGTDTGVESLTIENKSKKKINLKGWSIATGWKKKFINHPIRENVIIKGKKEKEITHNVSSFTLNNTRAKIQLRYPDGKVAHEVKYKTPNKTIAEGEIYHKEKGKKWEWVSQKPITNPPAGGQDTKNNQETITNNQTDTSEMQNTEPETQKLEDVQISLQGAQLPLGELSSYGDGIVKIELLKSEPRMLNARTVREVDGQYFFTSDVRTQEHYAVLFFKNIFFDLNSRLNSLLNYFAK